MKHIIIGTAGHIDHGKTTLIKALTGRDTDRLKEEKDRGISIELGFTYFDLPSGRRAGIIDVPGHERFIKNMLAGVTGMDIVLLVVAADEGVMPQTKEHIAIIDLLGIEKGFVVLTKSDLVDSEWLELVKEDIKNEVKGSFLENAPIVPVSSVKKTGLDKVIELIDELALELEDRETDDTPRLPVDRVFSIAGFGTVVTGTLLSGKFRLGDEVQIFPGNKLARIRNLQVHEQDTDIAYAGQRVAINMAGIKKEEVERGDVIAPKDSMKDTLMLDVKVRLIKDINRPIMNRTRLRLYIGTKEILCRIVLLDKEVLNPGEEAYAQLRLEEKTVAKRGDRFILRFYSPMFTIGGGQVLEPNPTKKQPFDEKALEELRIKEAGKSIDIIERIVLDKSQHFPTIREISTNTAMLEEKVKEDIDRLIESEKIIPFKLTKDIHVIHVEYFNMLTEKIIKEMEIYHERYPLRIGIPKEEMRSRLLSKAPNRVGELFLDRLIEMGLIEQKRENIFKKGFKVEYKDYQIKIKNKIIESFKEKAFLPPRKEELINIDPNSNEVEEVINNLVSMGEIVKLNEEVYIHQAAFEEAIKLAKNYIKENGSITVAQYRDVLNTNRKVALSLLEYFDQLKITKRDGDKRMLVGNTR
ncbi:selenocysteine-specific translation elongation factor [Tepidimicrobium xylanilyticum]|uniref:Selenocysteine-specific elongation factor n=1 Tax=Tepidimicrobium xylanilyticum TaxID=1123352 RepID=A0A1H3BSM4_9FIRM|nr:selenocysteine-specific translation elongation factor [Tepidimicrobium xylanilyticum]GMG97232.1 selenocysteine-specific translation factor [Tepidimicrobium xylanilyticum]SDX44374.1 selenocysteine-specific elongation factor [Tepidimicrobium xylanilyticum]